MDSKLSQEKYLDFNQAKLTLFLDSLRNHEPISIFVMRVTL